MQVSRSLTFEPFHLKKMGYPSEISGQGSRHSGGRGMFFPI
jgi:hypothetical protein